MIKKKERKKEEKKNVKSWLRHLSIFMAMKKNMELTTWKKIGWKRARPSLSCAKHLRGEYI